MLWTDDIDIALEFVLTLGGESLRIIIIGNRIYDEKQEKPRGMVDGFLAACPNVRTLSAFACTVYVLLLLLPFPTTVLPRRMRQQPWSKLNFIPASHSADTDMRLSLMFATRRALPTFTFGIPRPMFTFMVPDDCDLSTS